jgi:3-oxoacyl-[acyl-carrier-protein] synthase II
MRPALALDDAGLKEDAEACASMDMIVAAGGGERDIAVDTLIVEESRKRNDREQLLNEKLTTELRPTLFLAQLSNLSGRQHFHCPQGHRLVSRT